MVQLWPGIPPEVLCDMYLNSCLNEGLNLLIRHHMAKGHRIDGWIRNGCVNMDTFDIRLMLLIAEMKNRGKSWAYKIKRTDINLIQNYIAYLDRHEVERTNFDAINQNPAKLAAKCRACRYRETKCKGKETCEDRLKTRGMM